MSRAVCLALVFLWSFSGARAASSPEAAGTRQQTWSGLAAANYLDNREAWWLKWPMSQRDHETACVSCHTALPYALSRHTLRSQLDEKGPTPIEQAMLRNVVKRVSLWSEVQPFYTDAQAGPNKTVESRGTEAILNALILANYDAENRHLSDVTRTAFERVWALQKTSGADCGAWEWLNFHNAPWEGNESKYMGAAYAAIALGIAPEDYRAEPSVAQNRKLLTSYLRENFQSQPIFNQVLVLWASARLPELLTSAERSSLEDTLFSQQREDGGWSVAKFGPWKRKDNTELEVKSDGYSTGLSVFALEQAGLPAGSVPLQKARKWLAENQSREEGLWPSYSVNKKRDPNTDIGHFMSDAATAFAVMALTNSF